MTSTRLVGHELQYEGAPYDNLGMPMNRWHGGSGGTGRGKCSCGEMSLVLDSGAKRKQWHREHKEEVRAGI